MPGFFSINEVTDPAKERREIKYAIFGDIHGNLAALERVLEDAAEQGCTHFACLGDLVGGQGDSAGCVERIRRLGCPAVKGNRDLERLWMDAETKAWMRELPPVLQVEDFTIVHATLDVPTSWAYVVSEFDAMCSFSYQLTPVCFHGHTHIPRFWVKDGKKIECEPLPSIAIQPGRTYLINPGSVGQPRDGDYRAAYAVYDTGQQMVTVRRLDYELV